MRHSKDPIAKAILTESSKSPASIAKSNKQWVGTCLYQEECKLLLINCGAVIRLWASSEADCEYPLDYFYCFLFSCSFWWYYIIILCTWTQYLFYTNFPFCFYAFFTICYFILKFLLIFQRLCVISIHFGCVFPVRFLFFNLLIF